MIQTRFALTRQNIYNTDQKSNYLTLFFVNTSRLNSVGEWRGAALRSCFTAGSMESHPLSRLMDVFPTSKAPRSLADQ